VTRYPGSFGCFRKRRCIFVNAKPDTKARLPDWERVLSEAARFQRHFPDAVFAGETAAALYAGHRYSFDVDHVLIDLRDRFERVLSNLNRFRVGPRPVCGFLFSLLVR